MRKSLSIGGLMIVQSIAGAAAEDVQPSSDTINSAIHSQSFHLERRSLCEDVDIEIYAIVDAEESEINMRDACGKIYVFLYEEGEERALTAGSLYYPEKIDPSSYERYKMWFSTFWTSGGKPDDGTVAFTEEATQNGVMNQSYIVTKYRGNENVDAWIIYNIGLADYGEGTIMQFYSTAYTMKPDLSSRFYAGDELIAARVLQSSASRWFNENAGLIAHQSMRP